jgi:hypothetical protein
VIGRIWWDHWLVWKARQQGAAVVEASEQVTAVHQNHNYGYHPAGARGVWTDEQAAENYRLAGGRWHLYTINDATHILLNAPKLRTLDGAGLHTGVMFAQLHPHLVRHSQRQQAGKKIVRPAAAGPGCRTAQELAVIWLIVQVGMN